jgi:hypothetical protein
MPFSRVQDDRLRRLVSHTEWYAVRIGGVHSIGSDNPKDAIDAATQGSRIDLGGLLSNADLYRLEGVTAIRAVQNFKGQ